MSHSRPSSYTVDDRDGSTIRRFDDGCRLIRLSETATLLRESRRMENCLNDLERFAYSEVFSLRDASDHSVANVEIRAGLLIQIAGPANRAVPERYHHHLRQFLLELGIPSSDITARLGFIEFGKRTFSSVEGCSEAFIEWCSQHSSPSELPFQRHPIIREFLNVFARHGRAAKEPIRKKVEALFTPEPPAWRQADGAKSDAVVRHPRFPTALLHLTRYGALDSTARNDAFRTAILDISAIATRNAEKIYDLGAENRIFGPEAFADLLERTGTREQYEQARSYACSEKAAALQGIVAPELVQRLKDDFLMI